MAEHKGQVELEDVKIQGKDGSSKVWLMPMNEFLEKFGTQVDLANPRLSKGLSPGEAEARVAKYGKNVFTPVQQQSDIVRFLLGFTDPFMVMLLVAGVLSFIAYSLDRSQAINMYLGILLFAVTIFSCVFSFVQEGKATSAMEAFKSMLPQVCHVIRNGHEQDIPAADLVPGDVIRMSTGDKVPADARLFFVRDLKVEMSSLTGEPDAISRYIESKEKEDHEKDASNLVFSSAQCIEGEGFGVVVATGDHTYIGRIAKFASDAHVEDTPLTVEVKIVVKRVACFALILAIAFFIIGMVRSGNFILSFVNGFIVVALACVPEGLPMTVVSCLTIASKRMAKNHVFVKTLPCVETLGSVNLICSDKTGTLTQNKMCVENFWFDLHSTSGNTVSQAFPPARLRPKHPADPLPTFAYIEAIMAVCNRTRFEDHRELSPEDIAVCVSFLLLTN
eukprot:TRINITY_DN6382_c0_g1_i9.p1 TRINITY_DN6382_c0_g1~~TRINITY_DN6382_c0_g1_i9.p1  ORF type:complete len:474 (-),score=117.37 TRINITY_DN6382_c0_g1_i9:96-1439(-)